MKIYTTMMICSYLILCMMMAQGQDAKLTQFENIIANLKDIHPSSLTRHVNGFTITSEKGLTITNKKNVTYTTQRLIAICDEMKFIGDQDVISVISYLRDPDVHVRFMAAWILNVHFKIYEDSAFYTMIMVYCRQDIDLPPPLEMRLWLDKIKQGISQGTKPRANQ